MKFGEIPVAQALGAVLAHSRKFETGAGRQSFKKGRVLSAEDIDILRQAGVESVIAARLEAGDVSEDEAAGQLAAAVCGDGVIQGSAFTGRCNLFAARRGLTVIDQDTLNSINTVDESLTVATVPPWAIVDKKQMLATVKIIPFAAARASLERCVALACEAVPVIRVAAFSGKRAGLIQTLLPGIKDSMLDKTTRVLKSRLEALNGDIIREIRCNHVEQEVATAVAELIAAGAELVLIAGASAIVDRRDIVPAAIARAGGKLVHYGMPVDPGNLLLLARHGEVSVLGLPGCARSPKFNGLDQVLERLVANIPVASKEIMALGAGGLLKDFSPRPAPRTGPGKDDAAVAPARAPRIHALVLAGGQSRRMGEVNKLLLEIDGAPMIARIVAMLLTSQVDEVLVVTGHQRERVEQALADYRVRCIYNPAYAEGLSTSLRAGIAALPEDVDGALVCLGDMPRVGVEHVNRLLAAFDPLEGRAICVPTYHGKPGNPVLWAQRFFAEMEEIRGDVGAKHLIGEHAEAVCEVETGDRGVLTDVDSPEAFASLKNY